MLRTIKRKIKKKKKAKINHEFEETCTCSDCGKTIKKKDAYYDIFGTSDEYHK
ncbi:hypothetical protein GQ473_06085 [archaeon]|nr:hypothetical protein [archaeon]